MARSGGLPIHVKPMSDPNLAANPSGGPSDIDDFVAEVTINTHGNSICTIYPIEASGMELMTTWVTAEEGSFVDLEAQR